MGTRLQPYTKTIPKPLVTIGETMEIIGKSWFPCPVGPQLKTAPTDPFPGTERFQNKNSGIIGKPLKIIGKSMHFIGSNWITTFPPK